MQFHDTVVISMDFGVHCQMESAGMSAFKLCSREASSSISNPSFQNAQKWWNVFCSVRHSREWLMLIIFVPLPEDIENEHCGQDQCFELVWGCALSFFVWMGVLVA